MRSVRSTSQSRTSPSQGRRSRIGAWRRWLHVKRGHAVLRTVVRDYTMHHNRYDFYWRRGWACVQCDKVWPA